MEAIKLTLNGELRTIEANPGMPLVWVLRDVLGLTGTKFSCGVGLCGACTVHIDGKPVHSCMTSLASAEGKQVTTIEGLSPTGQHPLQKSWIDEQVAQCGYCQPGMIMRAAFLLAEKPAPSHEEIIAYMNSNICRCGTYKRVIRAIQRAAQAIRDQ
jgi:isoquinoline 1-oxidoreductase alpha subunit